MTLADRYRKGTEFVSVGRFTLDETRARDKIARFQLTDQVEALPLLAQAAVAMGAEKLTFASQSTRDGEFSLSVRIVGAELDSELLESLDDLLFEGSRETLPYHLISVALNALRQSSGSAELKNLSRGRGLEIRTPWGADPSRLADNLSERFQHLGISWSLFGVERSAVSVGEGRESIQILPHSQVTEILLVRLGVLVGRRELQKPLNFRAVVRDDRFRLDASFADVVEDEVFVTRIEQTISSALERASEWAEMQSNHPERRALLRRLSLLKHGEPLDTKLASLPLFPYADRHGAGSRVELEALLKKEKVLFFSDRILRLQMSDPVLYFGDDEVNRACLKLFGERNLKRVDALYDQRQRAVRNRERWKRAETKFALPSGRYLARKEIGGPEWRGVLGISRDLSLTGTSVDVLYQGRFLSSMSLSGLVAGGSAVLDFEVLEVSEDWTGPTGRAFRATLRQVQTELRELMESVELSSEDLTPDLELALWTLLEQLEKPPNFALEAPLLEPVGDCAVRSLEEIPKTSTVYLVRGDRYLESLRLIPMERAVTLVYSERTESVLRKQIGPERVVDFRREQSRLQSIQIQLEALSDREVRSGDGLPWPELTDRDGWSRHSFFGEGWEAVAVLGYGHPERALEVSFVLGELVIDTASYRRLSVLRAELQLRGGRVVFTSDFKTAERGSAFDSLMSEVVGELHRLEAERATDSALPVEVRRQLLSAYPQRQGEAMKERLFSSTGGAVGLFSARELQEEIEEYGDLVTGSVGARLQGRRVLLKPALTQEQGLLEAMLGTEPTYLDIDNVLERQKLEVGFYTQPVLDPIVVKRRAHRKLRLEGFGDGLSGELAVGDQGGVAPRSVKGLAQLGLSRLVRGEYTLPEEAEETEDRAVSLYYHGRFVRNRRNVLPPGCRAALEHPSFEISEDFSHLRIPDEEWETVTARLQERLESAIIDLLEDDREAVCCVAWDLLSTVTVSRENRQAIFGLPLFSTLSGGGNRPLDEVLSDGADTLSYVSSLVPFQGLTFRNEVVEISDAWLPGVRRLTGLKLREESRALKDAVAVLEKARRLPRQVCREHHVQRFESGTLRCEVGIAADSWLVIADDDSIPRAHQSWRGLPAQVFVSLTTDTVGKRRGDRRGRFRIGKSQREQLEGWVELAYLDWLEQRGGAALSRVERTIASSALAQLARELQRESDQPRSRLAHMLWQLPLFPRVDKTWECGPSLVATSRDLEEPIVTIEPGDSGPGYAIEIDPEGPEYKILRSVLGGKGLRKPKVDEIPPRFSPMDFLNKSLRIGLRPAARMTRYVGSALVGTAAYGRTLLEGVDQKLKGYHRNLERAREVREKRLLTELHNELGEILDSSVLRRLERSGRFPKLEYGRWPLGAPIYLVQVKGDKGVVDILRLNFLHPEVRNQLQQDDKIKSGRPARKLLVLYWLTHLVKYERQKVDEESEGAGADRILGRNLQLRCLERFAQAALDDFGDPRGEPKAAEAT